MRKFGCLFLAILIFVFGIKPSSVSAAESAVFGATGALNFETDRNVDSPVTFNSVRNANGVDFPWVFNSVEPGVSNMSINVEPGYGCIVDSSVFTSEFEPILASCLIYPGFGSDELCASTSFSFVNAGSQFVSWDRLDSLQFYNEFDETRILEVRIAFYVSFPVYSDDFWDQFIISSVLTEGSRRPVFNSDTGQYVCYLGQWMKEMIMLEYTVPENCHYVAISDLIIEINYVREGDTPLAFGYEYLGHTGSSKPLALWFDNFDLSLSSADSESVFDWLIGAVEGFLDFEIAPNLSINKILYIILVIGIILWFITLLI